MALHIRGRHYDYCAQLDWLQHERNAVYVAVRVYLEGAPWLVWILAPLLIFAVASAATYYSLRAIDWWKNRGARELRERYKNFDENAEKELLDYIVEGEQAIRDVASEMMKMNKDTHRLARKTKFATFRLNLTSNPRRRLGILAGVAKAVRLNAGRVEDTVRFMDTVSPLIDKSYKYVIQKSKVENSTDIISLKYLVETMDVMLTTIPVTVRQIKEFRRTYGSLKGISGELSAATDHAANKLGDLIERIEEFGRISAEVRAIAQSKLDDANATPETAKSH